MVASTLNGVHAAAQLDTNRGRKARDPPKLGDKVWVLRPKGVGGNKISTWWLGPYKVVERVGQSSFKVQIRPGIFQDVHLDQIKPYELDEALGIGRPLTYRRDELDQPSQRKVQKLKTADLTIAASPNF